MFPEVVTVSTLLHGDGPPSRAGKGLFRNMLDSCRLQDSSGKDTAENGSYLQGIIKKQRGARGAIDDQLQNPGTFAQLSAVITAHECRGIQIHSPASTAMRSSGSHTGKESLKPCLPEKTILSWEGCLVCYKVVPYKCGESVGHMFCTQEFPGSFLSICT